MSEEQLYGGPGVEQSQGFTPIPEAPAPAEPALEESINKWAEDREQEEHAKPIINREYEHQDGENRGKPFDEKSTVSAERAARDLKDLRDAEAALSQMDKDAIAAFEIDQAWQHGQGESRRALDAQQQTPQTAEQQQTEQPQYSDGLEGVDPEVAAALRNPKVLNVLSNHYSAAEAKVAAAETNAAAHVSAAIQQTAQWAQTNAELAAAAILARPELRGVHPSQIPGAIQALATANPQAAQQIQQQINHATALVQQSQEAQRVQQQRSAMQYQQQFASYAQAQDQLFERSVAGVAPETIRAIGETAKQILREGGLTDAMIAHEYNNSPLLRSAVGQQVLADAARYRMLKAGVKPAPRAIPNVQRPGVSTSREEASAERDFAVEQRFKGNLSAKQASELLIARRARR
jgi:hypothetical protein